jgi:hypothetical protein
MCELFKSSLKRGFTPAALQMRVSCLSDIDTPEYIAGQGLAGNTRALCPLLSAADPFRVLLAAPAKAHRDTATDELAFRANLYFAMRDVLVDTGAKDKDVKFAYQWKALAYGCPRAQGWLDRQI